MADEKEAVQLVRVKSEWSYETLKAYVDQGLHEVDRRLTNDITHAKETARDAQANAQLANTKSEKASDDRFAGHNEFNRRIDSIVTKTVTSDAFLQFVGQYSEDKLATAKLMQDFVPRAAYEELRKTVEALGSRMTSGDSVKQSSKDSKEESRVNWGLIASIAVAIVIVMQYIVPHATTVINAAKP